MKFSNYILILIIFSSGTLFSQKNDVFVEIDQAYEKADELYSSDPDAYFLQVELAFEQALEKNYLEGIVKGHLDKARYLLLKSYYEETQKNLNIAIDSIEANRAKLPQSLLSYAYNLKSILMERLGDDEESIRYIKFAVELEKNNGNDSRLVGRMINLANSLIRVERYNEAKKTLDKIYQLDQSIEGTYYYNQNTGSYYLGIKDYQKAEAYYKRALKIALDRKMKDSEVTALTNISNLYYKKGNYAQAVIYLNSALDKADEYELIHEKLEAVNLGKDIYKNKGDLRSAFEFFELEVSLKDSLFNEAKVSRINLYEKKMDYSRKERELIKQEKENLKLKNEVLESQRSKDKFQTLLIVAGIVVVFIVGFSIFVMFNLKRIKKLNHSLNIARDELEVKNNLVEEALTDIRDSVHYSKRLQDAILPGKSYMDDVIPESFCLFFPKEIVSGDFYWVEEWNGYRFVAVGDCTGHGVPGSMVSMVAYNALTRAVKEHQITEPAKILDKVSEWIEEIFAKSDSEIKDGMDISLVVWNPKEEKICWAGANNPLWILRNENSELPLNDSEKVQILSKETAELAEMNMNAFSFIELKPDKQPVGKYFNKKPFDQVEVELKKGDVLYLFSDGFADQFGGEKGKKFKTSEFKKLVYQSCHLPLNDQSRLLEEAFFQWKGNYEQLDDVCVMGIKIL